MNQQLQAIKITYNGTVRRVGVHFFPDADWSAFCNQVRELFHDEMQGLDDGTLRVSYLDTDNDAVTFSSTPELQEALSSASSTLRIVIAPKGTSPFSKISTTITNGIDMVRKQTADVANSEALAMLQKGDLQGALNRLEEAATDIAKRAESAPILWFNLACVRSRANNFRGSIAALEESVKNGYTRLECMLVDKDLDPVRHYPEFAACVRGAIRNLSKDGRDTAAEVCSQIVTSLRTAKLEAAALLSQATTEVFPNDVRSFYNASCIESLRGNVNNAADYLQKAVHRGFNDMKMFLEDPDMKNLRESNLMTEVTAIFNSVGKECTQFGKDLQRTVFPPKTTTSEPTQQTTSTATTASKAIMDSMQAALDGVCAFGAQMEKELFPHGQTKVADKTAAPVPPQQPSAPEQTETAPKPPQPVVVPSLNLPTSDTQISQESDVLAEVLSVSSATTEPVETVEEISAPAPPSSAPAPVAEKYGAEMEKLREMGFQVDSDVLRRILEVHNGDVARCATQLLEA